MKGIASQDLTCVWKELRAKTRTGADPKDKMEPHLWGPGESKEEGQVAAQVCQATRLPHCPHVPARLLITAH